MKENREIPDQDEYEKSIYDRMYLGTLVVIGFVLGAIAVYTCVYLIAKLLNPTT